MVNLNQDFRELIGLLESEEVAYLIFSPELMECLLLNAISIGSKLKTMDSR